MSLGAWTDTSTWAPATTVQVWKDDDTWARAKKAKVWNGTTWVLAWVHPVTEAALSLSKTGVALNEAYNVVLTVPGGFPEGASVTFRRTGYTSTAVNPVEGATTATLTGTTNATSGTYSWFADVTTKGGNTSFGPISQSVAVTNTTVTLTAPAWVLSAAASGTGGATPTIAQATFTVAVGTPAIVSTLSLQLKHATATSGAWVEYKNWPSPAASQNHSIVFNSVGDWSIRAVATQTNAVVIYSTTKALPCYEKDLKAVSNNATPEAGDTVTYSASHTGYALAATSGRWQYLRPADAGVWHDNYSTANPLVWTRAVADDINWRWAESFSDGSTIYSNAVHSVFTAATTTVTVNGGHCHNIQAGMDSAAAQGKDLKLTGSFYLYTNVYIPSNLDITATGAVFYCNSTSAKSGATYDAGRFRNNPKGNAAGYGQAGGWVFNGGTFDGNGDGIFTISHSPGFTITNTRMYRYCSSANTGHAIECNSSGGADNHTGPYTVQITNNTFHGTDRGQRSNSNDEPCHYDWNWGSTPGSGKIDSGASEPLWRPGESISEATQTMCHNVRYANNTYDRANTNFAYAICAIGGHDSSDDAVRPTYRHNHFLIENNTIHNAIGSTGTSPNKGAIHLFRGRQFIARNNILYGGVQKRYLTAEDTGDKEYLTASGNTSSSPTLSSPNGITIEG